MILGDSITHGANGDWTWRYRLWQWLHYNTTLSPEFVGPFKGTFLDDGDPNTEFDTSGKYHAGTDGVFLTTSSGHAAYWGRALAQSKDTVSQWTRDHQPEYLLVMLGFNDLGWFVTDVAGALANTQKFIEEARRAKPDVKFFFANIVDRAFLGGREDLVKNTKEYNQRLPGLLQSMASSRSFVKLVDVNTAYECRPEGCPDAYDGLHPNPHGEYDIALAFSVAMVQAGFGASPLVVPFCGMSSPYTCPF
ncbi:SGNH hydrolase-type esterase domain-containing protein [Microdochium trichocladiopsis]|uniref:SGNH hydrolase-type esterase domain-containing protein n=1 Tax=Microdochium trichocladiopsis TaxID=1682393 RepID=A0A9P8XWD2_9PEZI|nr:SGNH hydrolase-type esterase domain-containing protein [Microdochium trichocladiopsis]KAH7021126.1 SGNH hydrolase-type esterase domain-containing protein [Microdochium trichocladiopsis]